MQVTPWASDHRSYALCVEMGEKWEQHAAVAESARALDVEFMAYGEPLERVEVIKYVGQLLSFDDDNNARAVMSNLKKARGQWSRISKVAQV